MSKGYLYVRDGSLIYAGGEGKELTIAEPSYPTRWELFKERMLCLPVVGGLMLAYYAYRARHDFWVRQTILGATRK
jgi:hypothetical protein